MIKKRKLLEFAEKWLAKFQDLKAADHEFESHEMANECRELGFEMDCGHAFSEKYGKAFHNVEELKKIIQDISDVSLIGSAIYSKWRYYNHWACSSILAPESREWFIIMLARLEQLSTAME